jgi:transposase InsO family protein
VAEVPREHIKRGIEMMEGQRRVRLERDTERAERRRRDYVKVVRRDGKVVEIAPDTVDQMKDKKGLRPAGRNGRSAAIYFGPTRSKYEQGPDGLYFEWDGGWVPSEFGLSHLEERFGGEVPSPQRDPDGNKWFRVGGEWVLESEVA